MAVSVMTMLASAAVESWQTDTRRRKTASVVETEHVFPGEDNLR